MELMMEHLANGFLVMLLITMPLVLTAAAIGLVVGILQAVTSVQEQTIAAAPKIFLVFLVIPIIKIISRNINGFFDDYYVRWFFYKKTYYSNARIWKFSL